MKRSSKSKSQNNYSSVRGISSARGREATELQNIMSSIKFLQKKVNNLPSSQAFKKSVKIVQPMTPKPSISCKNSQTKFYTASGKKNQNRDKSLKTKRKLEIDTKFQNTVKLN